MKHHVRNRKFGRPARQRKAMLRSLARSLVEHERIQTTEAKAKELRPYVERLITNARKNTLAARRRVISELGTESGAKMCDDVGKRYTERPGGYTRVVKLPPRQSDGARMAVIELVA